MDPYPTRLELVTLFESEPSLMDADLSWHHNTVEFRWDHDVDRLDVLIEPTYGELSVRWLQHGIDRLELKIRHVEGLDVEIDRGHEALVAAVADPATSRRFRLQLKPHVHVLWATD